MKIIYKGSVGLPTDGVVLIHNDNIPIKSYEIFVDDPMNLIGLQPNDKSFSDSYNNVLVLYIEVGLFLRMIYDGIPEPFDVIMGSKESGSRTSYEFDIIASNSTKWYSDKLIKNMINDAIKNKNSISEIDESNYPNSGGWDGVLGEHKSRNKTFMYNAARSLFIVRNINLYNEYMLRDTDVLILQSIVSDKINIHEFNSLSLKLDAEIKGLLDVNTFNNVNYEELNDLLLNIRNIKITDMNYV